MGALNNYSSVLCQSFPAKPTFNVDQIPDLTGRVIIVTGMFRCFALKEEHISQR